MLGGIRFLFHPSSFAVCAWSMANTASGSGCETRRRLSSTAALGWLLRVRISSRSVDALARRPTQLRPSISYFHAPQEGDLLLGRAAFPEAIVADVLQSLLADRLVLEPPGTSLARPPRPMIWSSLSPTWTTRTQFL
jgi:hypothetical protein